MKDYKKEAEVFDNQVKTRIDNGFIPDLRRLKKVDWFYNNVWRDPEFVKIMLIPRVNFVIDILKERKGKVAEFGCGYGYLSLEIARNGMDVTGVDLSPYSIELAKKFASENTYKEGFGSLNYKCDNILTMDLGKEVFDSIVFFLSMHHLPDIEMVISKSYDALKDGGNFIIVEPIQDDIGKATAEFILAIRSVLPTWIDYDKKTESIADNWDKRTHDILNEYLLEGEYTQSPNDNTCFSGKQMIKEIENKFVIKKLEYEGAFIDHIIGGLRGENKYKLAKILKIIDDNMVRTGALMPGIIKIHATKSK